MSEEQEKITGGTNGTVATRAELEPLVRAPEESGAMAKEEPVNGVRIRWTRPRPKFWVLVGIATLLGLPLLKMCAGASAGAKGKGAIAIPDAPTGRPPAPPRKTESRSAEPSTSFEEKTVPELKDSARRTGQGDGEGRVVSMSAAEAVKYLKDHGAGDKQDKKAGEKEEAQEGKISLETPAAPPPVLPGRERTVDVPANGSISIKVRPSTAEQSYQTVVILSEEESIESTVTSWREQDVSTLTKGNAVLIKLRNEKAGGDLHAVGKSGIVYRLLVTPGSAEDYDAIVTVRTRGARAPGAAQAPNRAIELASAMYQRTNPAGTQVFDGEGEILYERGGLTLKARWVYETAELLGYVLEASNTRETSVLIEKERFAGAGLILAGAEAVRLEPKESTWIYLIFQRGTNEP